MTLTKTNSQSILRFEEIRGGEKKSSSTKGWTASDHDFNAPRHIWKYFHEQ